MAISQELFSGMIPGCSGSLLSPVRWLVARWRLPYCGQPLQFGKASNLDPEKLHIHVPAGRPNERGANAQSAYRGSRVPENASGGGSSRPEPGLWLFLIGT